MKFVTAFLSLSLVLSLAPSAPLDAQVPAADSSRPAFTSASITLNTTGEAARGRMNFEPGGRFSASNVTLRQLLETAYRRHAFDRREISGGPSWIDTDRFDVVGIAPSEHVVDSDGALRQTWMMLRTLLVDNLKVKVRYENKGQPVYALVVANMNGQLGPGLSRSGVDCADVMAKLIRGERPAGDPQCGFGPYPRRLVARAIAMPDLASYLSMLVKQPVLDQTGLTGNFDLEVEGVEVVQPGPPGPSTRSSDTTRSIIETLPEQLGLKLVRTAGSVEVVVIDHVEKPEQK